MFKAAALLKRKKGMSMPDFMLASPSSTFFSRMRNRPR